ncbi:MAG: hypothetical protein R3E60_07710 [Alphaproteobacteria bacterium]
MSADDDSLGTDLSPTSVGSASLSIPAVDAVIAAFGGIRPMATKLGISFTTVQGWKTRAQIPPARWPEVEAAAKANGIDLASLPSAAMSDGSQDVSEPETASRREDHFISDPPRRGSGGVILVTLATMVVLIALALGTGYITRSWWLPPTIAFIAARAGEATHNHQTVGDNEDLSQRLDQEIAVRERIAEEWHAQLEALAQQVAELETRIEEMSSDSGATGGTPDNTSDVTAEISRRITALERAIAEQENRTGNQSLNELETEVRSLEDRLERMGKQLTLLEAQSPRLAAVEKAIAEFEERSARADSRLNEIENLAGVGSGQTAAIFALNLLHQAARGSAPFTTELETARKYIKGDDGVQKLMEEMMPFAEKGVASREELLRQLSEIAPSLLTAPETRNGDWWAQFLAKLKTAVVIRSADSTVDPGAPANRLAAAEARLQAGDLSEAMDLVAALPGAAQGDAWLTAIKMRIGLEKTLNQLERTMLEQLGRTAHR